MDIIKNFAYNKHYVGYTSNLEDRLKWHNEGKSKWSRRFIPWDLVYFEEFLNKTDAIKREKQIKRNKSKSYIERLISTFGPVV